MGESRSPSPRARGRRAARSALHPQGRRVGALAMAAVSTLAIACGRSEAPPPAGSTAPPPASQDHAAGKGTAGALELTFTYGSEKQEWIDDVTAAFNASGTKTASG